MKKHLPLRPSIELIEQRFFGITDGLMQAVQRGATSAGISEAVRQTPEWTQYRSELQMHGTEPVTHISVTPESIEVPDHIRDLIRRRAAAVSLSTTRHPEPGQIVLVEKIVTPRPGQLDAIMQAPLYVLLNESSETPAIWHGWIVSGETDYASWWDFVLQEQDEPFDPEAGMVQVWNPVHLYLPMVKRTVGKLTLARLQSVRALAADFVTEAAPSDVRSWPGRVASRSTSTGLRVTTGSPLHRVSDSRSQYQDIYFKAAEAIKQPARLAVRALSTVPANSMGSLLNRFIAAAGRAAEILLPEPRVAIAMSAKEFPDMPDLSWPDTARLRILELTADGDGRMEITATGSETITIEVRRGSDLEEVAIVAPGSPDIVSWNRANTELTLHTESGKRLELNLKDLK